VREELTGARSLQAAALVALSLLIGCKRTQAPSKGKATAVISASPSAFPGSAPADAKELASGGRWQLVRPGKQPGPQLPRQLVAGVKVWDTTGKQIFSSAANPHGIVVGLDSLPNGIQEMIRLTGFGGVARAWLPPAAMRGWKPQSFPNEELLYEIEILGDLPPPVMEVVESGEAPSSMTSALAAASLPPPELSGPPKDARTTSSGLKFVVSSPGGAARPGPDAKLRVLADAWVAQGLTVEKTVRGHAVALTTQAAPAGLGDVLKQLGRGGRARVWVPAAKAREVFPQEKGKALVVDLTLQSIDGS
jgi:hypothetical protein